MVVEYFDRKSAKESLERVSRPKAGAWIHVSNATSKSAELQELSSRYSLDPNTVRDALDNHELSRAEYKSGAEYVFVRIPVGSADSGKTLPILCIITATQFITIISHAGFSPIHADRFIIGPSEKPSVLFVATIASVVTEYESRIRVLSEMIADARKRLSRREVQNADFIEFVAIEDSLSEYQSCIEGLSNVAKKLSDNRRQLFRARDLEALEDIILHSQQLLVSIKSSGQTIASIQNAYSTIANNTLNQRMKFLTAITILLAIPNVFYGMYGMNIALPFQHEPWAYPLIFGFTMLLILLVYLVAKRFRLF